MSKKILITVMIIFITLLIGTIKVNAFTRGTLGLVDKDGFDGDKSYAPSVQSLNEDINKTVTFEISDYDAYGELGKYGGDVTALRELNPKIKIKSQTNKERYGTDGMVVGDKIKVVFYIIDDNRHDPCFNDKVYKSVDGVEKVGDEKYVTKYDKVTTDSQAVIRDEKITFVDSFWCKHIKVEETITFQKEKSGEVDIPILIELIPYHWKLTIHIKVSEIIPLEDAKATDLRKYYIGHGYKKDNDKEKLAKEVGTHKFGTTGNLQNDVNTFINSYNLKEKKAIEGYSINPTFTRSAQTDGWSDDKAIKEAKVGFSFKVDKEQKVYSKTYRMVDGKPEEDTTWRGKTLEKDKMYTVIYRFIYLGYNNEMLYTALYTDDTDTAKQVDESGDSIIDDALSKVEQRYKLIVESITGEIRDIGTKFYDVLEDIDYYTNVGELDPNSSAKAEEKIGTVVKVITNIGIIISILMPAIVGIKYMLGSVEEKADYKKDMIPYFVGAVLLFGVCTVVKILQSIGNSINNI